MMSVIESNVMVNPINDSSNFKPLKSDSRLQPQQAITKENHTDEINQVNLSDTSRQMAALKEFILNVPEIDKARIEFIKEELVAGRYHISSEQIATKMFADIELA